jgi:ribonuclease D
VDSYVRSSEALSQVISAFRRDPLVAVDTEAASFHKYLDRIYLVQLSTTAQTAVIDPLAVADLTPLGALLADRAVEKVFHDADYDLRILDRDYRFRAASLFDTRVAAQLAGEPAIGLAALLEKYVGVKLSKTHQRADWSQRPLPPEMLAYAADDTRHLPALREALRIRLRELGRLDWAEEEFGPLEALRWTGAANSADGYLRLKGAGTLTGRQLGALRELYRWREELAAQQDRATFRIIGNDALLAVSRSLPRTLADLGKTAGVPPVLAARHGPELLACVHRALALDERALPRIERSARLPKDPAFDARVERLKTVRTRVATEMGLDPGVLCGRGTLEAVARARPKDRAGLAQIGELRRWQIAVLGDALLATLD